jgi:hypothetical protein
MSNLKQGHTGIAVKDLQHLLRLTPDGFFGQKTHDAVVKFQQKHDLVPDGIVGPATWKLLSNETQWLRNSSLLSGSPALQPHTINSKLHSVINSITKYGDLVDRLANILMIEPAAAHAAIAVESAGSGMHDGDLVIRFEAHVFWRKWGKYHPVTFAKHWNYNKKEPWKDQTFNGNAFHNNQAAERNSFITAWGFDRNAAIESISMGAGQLMGFHWKTLGFTSPELFYRNQQGSERNQIIAFFDFIQVNPIILTALQEKDWWTFAYHYNGSGQPEVYSEWLQQRFTIAKTILEAT